MSALVRVLGNRIPPVEMVFFRNLVGLSVLVPSLIFWPVKQKGGQPWLLFFRGLIGTFALLCLFTNLNVTTLALANTFVQTSPIFIAITSALFLGERLKPFSYLAIVIGFSGVLILLAPGGSLTPLASLLGIGSSIGTALAYTAVAGLRTHYDTRTIVLAFCTIGSVLPLILFFIAPYVSSHGILQMGFVTPTPMELFWLLCIGLTALMGQVCITLAYGWGKAGVIATIGYSQIMITAGFGLFFGDPLPAGMDWLGIALIVVGGVMVSQEGK